MLWENIHASLFVVDPLPIVIVRSCGQNHHNVRRLYKLPCALSSSLPLSAIHTYPPSHLTMAQLPHVSQVAHLPRSVVTRTQLHDCDTISRYRTCEATRFFAALVNATGEELDDTQSYLSFPRTVSSDNLGDTESERSYSTRATTPSETPAVRSFVLSSTFSEHLNEHYHFAETVQGSQGPPPPIP